MEHPALGILEFNSIAQGIKAADEAMKKSHVDVLLARTICPGKYLVIINGDIDEVKESLNQSSETGEYHTVDSIVIANLHSSIPDALIGSGAIENKASIGIVETFSAPSAIQSADAAVKAASVELIEIRVANGIGGKSFYTLTGEESSVNAALSAGVEKIKDTGLLMNFIVIPSPHSELYRHIL